MANEHTECVTVVGCGNSIGSAIPSMILFRQETKARIPRQITFRFSGFCATELYAYNPDHIPEEAFGTSALSELPNPTYRDNTAVLPDESGEQEISTANVENSDASSTDTENFPLSLLSKC
ncbi:hypothetical protein WA026_020880 [Henosepilachna vigintioctopunctata]|uniref:Uncharacterized protein n=1 Tax=Henosepilachna vigintioctopunctata TaxID=420089 RepID=A0AAW1UFA1_9CUCU